MIHTDIKAWFCQCEEEHECCSLGLLYGKATGLGCHPDYRKKLVVQAAAINNNPVREAALYAWEIYFPQYINPTDNSEIAH